MRNKDVSSKKGGSQSPNLGKFPLICRQIYSNIENVVLWVRSETSGSAWKGARWSVGVLECWKKSSGSCFYRSDYIEIKIDTPTGIWSLFHYSSTPLLHFGLFKTIPFPRKRDLRQGNSRPGPSPRSGMFHGPGFFTERMIALIFLLLSVSTFFSSSGVACLIPACVRFFYVST